MTGAELARARGAVARRVEEDDPFVTVERERRRRHGTATRARALSTHAVDGTAPRARFGGNPTHSVTA
jgi:hypothetical protein